MTAPALRDPHISIAFREAVDALERGWSVIPIDPKTKKAMVPWKDYQDTPATLDELHRWKDQKGFAVVTGEVPVVGLTIASADVHQGTASRNTQFYLQCIDDRFGNLILNREYVCEFPVIAL